MKPNKSRTMKRYGLILRERHPYDVGERGNRRIEDEKNFEIQKQKMTEHILKLNLTEHLNQDDKRRIILAITKIIKERYAESNNQIPNELIEPFSQIRKQKLTRIKQQLIKIGEQLQELEPTNPREHTMIHAITNAIIILKKILNRIN